MLKRPPQPPDVNLIQHLWDVVNRKILICSNCVMLHVKMDQNLIIFSISLNLCHEGKRGSNLALARCTVIYLILHRSDLYAGHVGNFHKELDVIKYDFSNEIKKGHDLKGRNAVKTTALGEVQ